MCVCIHICIHTHSDTATHTSYTHKHTRTHTHCIPGKFDGDYVWQKWINKILVEEVW